MKISGNFESFPYFNFETNNQKKLFFRKTAVLDESTKIESASFPFKIAMSKANIKTNRMVSTKRTYHKERSFASKYFIILEILFQFINLLQRADLMYQRFKCPYTYFP